MTPLLFTIKGALAKAAILPHPQSCYDQGNDTAGKQGDDGDLFFREKRLDTLTIWNCDLAVALDHLHHVIAKSASVHRHVRFVCEYMTVKDGPLVIVAIMKRAFR